ncbi:glutathione S-transferase family protein [Pararhodobacter sp. CCB-MM2]|uniref:glutathione S-transferase family protein n=1 Tax=Pararhodobacter sp. CCB-MM2 TaxID=1786003 RepID=UPI00083278D4|nr:glutathione S-transferase family protein [Pararhodobacter sp. CCB-MM2]
MIELWHCKDARSLRALWTLEELELPYTLHLLKFPPRFTDPGFTEVNSLGTVPYLKDGETRMTESSGIAHYLATRYGEGTLAVAPDSPDYGDWLNWMYHSDATLTFPQTLVLRYGRFEPKERRQPQVVDDYTQWFFSRLKLVNARLEGHEYLCADRFTAADITVGYALYLTELIGLGAHLKPQTRAYLERLMERPGFQRANDQGQPLLG